MPWTSSKEGTLPSLKNKPEHIREVFARVANAALAEGKTEQDAIASGLGAIIAAERKDKVQKEANTPTHLKVALALASQQKALESPTSSQNASKVQRPIQQAFLGKNTLQTGLDRNLVSADWSKTGELILTFDTGEKITTSRVPVSENIEQYVSVSPDKFRAGTLDNIIFVSSIHDLPPAVNNVIFLENDFTYFFVKEVDLNGARIVAGRDNTILGTSSENAGIKSTGLVGEALISSNFSLPMRGLAIEADIALDLNGDGVNTALDWFGVNFVNCRQVGTVANYTNFIMTDCAFLNSAGLVLDGTIGSVAFNSSLFSGVAGFTTITVPSTAVITRRFRIIYSAIIAPAGAVSLDVSPLASIPVEGYILDTVNHSGEGTATIGVDYTDNKSLFTNCRGISNSAQISNYYMSNNAVITAIPAQNTPVKIAGNTSSNIITQKFTNTDNRATYTGALSRSFKVSAVASVETGTQNLQIGFYVAKNGVVLPESEIYVTTNVNNRAENVAIQCILKLEQNDYIEIFAENSTNATDFTVTFLNTIVEALN